MPYCSHVIYLFTFYENFVFFLAPLSKSVVLFGSTAGMFCHSA
jgi:hypothetical protein